MRGTRRPLRLLMPLGAALGAALFVGIQAQLFLGKRSLSDPRYLVARRSLPAEHPLSLGDLAVGEGGDEAGAITDQELALLKDAVLLAPLAAGEPLTWKNVGTQARLAATVPRGLRAYTLRPANALPMAPRDRVDIIWRAKEGEPAVLVEAALVLRSRRGPEGWECVVALPADDIPVLEKAARGGTLTIALRHPEDGSRRGKARSKPRRIPGRKRIEIWAEDK